MFCSFNCKLPHVQHSPRGVLVIRYCIHHLTGLQNSSKERCLCSTSPKQHSVPAWGCPEVGRTQPYLSGEAPPQVHGTRASFVGLQPQHHRGGQLVMGSAATGLLLQVEGNKKGQDKSKPLLKLNGGWPGRPHKQQAR